MRCVSGRRDGASYGDRDGGRPPGARLAAWLLVLCALGAVLAAVVAVPTVRAADPTTQGAEAWRMVGYLFFAGVFILLARAPRAGRGLFELTIAAKLALPIAALTIARSSDDAITFLVADGLVAGFLIVAYVLARFEPRPSR